MTAIRTFIAIELSDEARGALTDLQHRLKASTPPKSVRWTAPENIHLTLHFLGETQPNNIEKIEEVLRVTAAVYAPFSLALGGLGCFPHARRPRIIWVGLMNDTNSLVRLHHELGKGLQAEIGYMPETRPYAPHLTIGRVNRGLPTRQLSQIGETIEREQAGVGQLATLQVVQISLIKSELKPAGPIYTPLVKGSLESRS